MSPQQDDSKFFYDPRVWDCIDGAARAEVAIMENEIKVPSNGVCHVCQGVFDTWSSALPHCDLKHQHWYQLEFSHHSSLLACRATVKKGCRVCSMLLRGRKDLDDRDKDTAARELAQTLRIVHEPLTVEFSWSRTNGEEYWELGFNSSHLIGGIVKIWENTDKAGAELFESNMRKLEKPLESTSLVRGGKFEGHLTSKSDSIQLASHWLKRCTTSHKGCKSGSERVASRLPSRMLCIKDNKVRLCNTSKLESPRYCTLSHCWGNLDLMTLTRENLATFENDLPFRLLCKTFQDAIFVARNLNIQFIWIDSLCIIQNDERDWERESARMCDVYGGSYLNIAAASAKDGNHGLFSRSGPELVWGHHIYTVVNRVSKRFECAYRGIYPACLTDTPLSKRAWVVQERILATRTLHFNENQLFWECREHDACESFPHGMIAPLNDPLDKENYLPKEPLPILWPAIAELYSGCDLTFSKDKLVAISGVASKISIETGNKYLAGLWMNNIEIQLMWSVLVESPVYPKPLPYRAPSWSWASIDSRVRPATEQEFHDEYNSVYVEVTHASIIPCGPNELGEISAGILRMNCRICVPIAIKPSEATDPGLTLFYKNFSADIDKELAKWGIYWDYSGCEEGVYYLVPIILTDQTNWTEENLESFIQGIVLKRVDRKPGHYERVGMFLSLHDHTGENINAMRAGPPLEDCDYVERIKDDNEPGFSYTIVII